VRTIHQREHVSEINCLDIYALALKCNLIDAHRLERRRACTDCAKIESAHPIHHPAHCSKVPQIFSEFWRTGMHGKVLRE
jgi:hypothetical protein